MTTIHLLLAGSSLLLFAACGAKSTAVITPPPSAPAAVAPEVVAVLAKADAKDGKTDKVVHQCAGCALGMAGKAEFSLPVADYTMHFCKPACLDAFKPDPAKAILALKIKD